MIEKQTMTGASETLELLSRKLKNTEEPMRRPDRLEFELIDLHPELFQPRYEALDEHHVQELARTIKRQGDLDPILLLPVGQRGVVIDGHHRLDAYKLACVTNTVPVNWFCGSVEEAVLEAGRINSKVRLVMGTQERMNYAWRLVLLDKYTKPEMMEASGASDGQLGKMRRLKRELGDDAYDFTVWQEALNHHQKKTRKPMDDDQREAYLENLANDYADRLHKAFGTKLGQNPEVAARALAFHLGRRLDGVVTELLSYVSEDALEENDDF